MTSTSHILSPHEEKQIAATLTPGVAWPTIVLACAVPLGAWSIIVLGAAHMLPLWLCTLLLAPLSYAHYSIVHECVHGNIFPKATSFRWLHEVFGWVGAIGIAQTYPLLKRTHLLHHTHTNTDDDPDIFVKGGILELFGKWVSVSVLSLLPIWITQHFLDVLRRYFATLEPQGRAGTYIVTSLYALSLPMAVWGGWFAEWTMLWFIPTRLGLLLLNIFFQWIAHYPFERTERYHNTNMFQWPGAALMTLNQNLHLVHHLWPSVPFYNYPPLFRALHPTLLAKGIRFAGLLVDPPANATAKAAEGV